METKKWQEAKGLSQLQILSIRNEKEKGKIMPENPQAFPIIGIETEKQGFPYSYEHARGMTLRDYFAGQALAGLCTNPGIDEEIVVKWSWSMADAMLKERTK